MTNTQKLEQKIGEALGLEKAAQVAVEELSAKGLLDEGGMKDKLQTMKKQANNHQTNLETFARTLSESEGLSSESIQTTAQETEQKAAEIMKTYLGEDPDSSEAIEFLCLAEGGEVTHYEVMSAMTKGIKDKKFATKVKSILAEEKRHLQLCTRLAKQTATA
jgi:hypothetical protein